MACLTILGLLPAAAFSAPKAPAPAPDRVTAREVVERQLAAEAAHPGGMSGAEAARLRELHLQRLGHPIEPRHDMTGGGRSGS